MNKINITSSNPTATIYQNETEVLVVFSPVDDKVISIRGATVKFENNWSDGAASGISGFLNNGDLVTSLEQNNFVKKGVVELSRYCYSKHENKDGSISTCMFTEHHKGEHRSEKGSWT